MERIGACKRLEDHTNQLLIADLDRRRLEQWQARARERSAGFGLGLWIGPYSTDQLAEIAHLYSVMNTAPRDELQMEDVTFSTLSERRAKRLFGRGFARIFLKPNVKSA